MPYGKSNQAPNTQGKARKYGGPQLEYDHSQMSNLPQQVMIMKYPPCPTAPHDTINYSITEVDTQIRADSRGLRTYPKGDALK